MKIKKLLTFISLSYCLLSKWSLYININQRWLYSNVYMPQGWIDICSDTKLGV